MLSYFLVFTAGALVGSLAMGLYVALVAFKDARGQLVAGSASARRTKTGARFPGTSNFTRSEISLSGGTIFIPAVPRPTSAKAGSAAW